MKRFIREECEGKGPESSYSHGCNGNILSWAHSYFSSSTLTSLCGGHPGVAGSSQVFLDVLDSLEDLVEAPSHTSFHRRSGSLFSVPATGWPHPLGKPLDQINTSYRLQCMSPTRNSRILGDTSRGSRSCFGHLILRVCRCGSRSESLSALKAEGSRLGAKPQMSVSIYKLYGWSSVKLFCNPGWTESWEAKPPPSFPRERWSNLWWGTLPLHPRVTTPTSASCSLLPSAYRRVWWGWGLIALSLVNTYCFWLGAWCWSHGKSRSPTPCSGMLIFTSTSLLSSEIGHVSCVS